MHWLHAGSAPADMHARRQSCRLATVSPQSVQQLPSNCVVPTHPVQKYRRSSWPWRCARRWRIWRRQAAACCRCGSALVLPLACLPACLVARACFGHQQTRLFMSRHDLTAKTLPPPTFRWTSPRCARACPSSPPAMPSTCSGPSTPSASQPPAPRRACRSAWGAACTAQLVRRLWGRNAAMPQCSRLARQPGTLRVAMLQC